LNMGDEYDSRRTPGIPATLSKYGFDYADPRPFDQKSVARVCEFLANAPKVLTPNGWYSYGLKHVVEEAIGQYVANGDCIAACILSGFVVKQDSRTQASVNATIGISKRWVKKQIAVSKRRELARGRPAFLQDLWNSPHKKETRMTHHARTLRIAPAHRAGPAMP
jgi:hypothetical protein